MIYSTPLRLDTREAARHLGVSVGTIRKWRYRGEPRIPYHKLGKKVVYAVTDLDEFLRANKKLTCVADSAGRAR